MSYIVVDIETAPNRDRAGWIETWKANEAYPGAPSNYRKAEALERHLREWKAEQGDRAQEAWSRTALSALDGRITVICALHRAGPDVNGCELSAADDTPEAEAEMLRAFWLWCRGSGPTWVGHYASVFDLPMLYRRSWILGVTPSQPVPNGWNDIADTRDLWNVTKANRDHVKLSKLATALGLDTKLERDDAPQVWQAWIRNAPGDRAWVVERCVSDVQITDAAYRRMRGLSPGPIKAGFRDDVVHMRYPGEEKPAP